MRVARTPADTGAMGRIRHTIQITASLGDENPEEWAAWNLLAERVRGGRRGGPPGFRADGSSSVDHVLGKVAMCEGDRPVLLAGQGSRQLAARGGGAFRTKVAR